MKKHEWIIDPNKINDKQIYCSQCGWTPLDINLVFRKEYDLYSLSIDQNYSAGERTLILVEFKNIAGYEVEIDNCDRLQNLKAFL
jgi:hypothetical protein